MSFDPPKKLKPGVLPTATDFNDLRQQIYALGRPRSDGHIGVEMSGYGLQITDLRSSLMLAKITSRGTGANYGWNQVIDNGDGTYTDVPTDTSNSPWGSATSGAAWELNGNTGVPVDGSAIVVLLPGQQDAAAFYFSYASTNTFLAVLTAKVYTANQHIAYTAIRVTDSNSTPVTYTDSATTIAPLYHVRNMDIPIRDAVGAGPAIGTDPLMVVRCWKAPGGNYYLFDVHPWVDLFRLTGASDANGLIAYHRYYRQSDDTWQDGREVRFITDG